MRIAVFCLLLVACAPSEREPVVRNPLPTPTREPAEPSPGPEPEPTPCDEGATKGCVVDLPTHGDVEHCATGERTCADGVWGPCEVTYSDPA